MVAPGDGSTTATWTFDNLTPGVYSVYATWINNRVNASDAPYSILDGQSSVTTVRVNQELAPKGLVWNGSSGNRSEMPPRSAKAP